MTRSVLLCCLLCVGFLLCAKSAAAQGIPVVGGGSLTNVRLSQPYCGGTAYNFYGFVYFNNGVEYGLNGGVLWATVNCGQGIPSTTTTIYMPVPTFDNGLCTVAFTVFNGNETSAVITCTAPTNPVIKFNSPNHYTLDSPFSVLATSNSSGAISYSLVSGPATVSPAGLVTLNGTVGTVVVQASQTADAIYAAATENTSFQVLAGSVWVGNSNETLTILGTDGSLLVDVSSGGLGIIGKPLGEAFDNSGRLWVAHSAGVSAFSFEGIPLQTTAFTGGGISTPVSVAVDGAGLIWIANANSTISVLQANGSPLSSSGGYQTKDSGTHRSIAIDMSGGVWVTSSAGSVTKVFGVATPVLPLANGVAEQALGTKP